MKTVLLGNTGVQVSALCLGAMYFGTRNDEATSFRLLDQYVEAGGSFIDTANIYAHWVKGFKGRESEALLGRWMKSRKNRSKMFIATKVGFEIPPLGVPSSLSASLIERECEKSLELLGCETIDLYYAHTDDRSTPVEETLGAFEKLVKAGKVRFIGASNFTAWRLEEAHWTSASHGWSEYCCVQQRHTYLRPKPGASFSPQLAANEDLFDYCRNRKMTLLAYSALLSGGYTRSDREIGEQYAGADSQARMRILRAVAEEKGCLINQVILAWMLHGNPFVLPLIAASTEAQLSENLGALEIKLTSAEMDRLDKAGG
jgi:aryl-alcohol dehydrogenase-like predicted oxidoreductase